MSEDLNSRTNLASQNRRDFLLQALRLSGQLFVANAVVYNIGMISKNTHGSLVAGAKACSPPGQPYPLSCPTNFQHYCCPGPPDTWSACLMQSPC